MLDSPIYWSALALAVLMFWTLPKRLRFGFLAAASWAYLFSISPQSTVAVTVWSGLFFWLAPRAIARRRFVTLLILGILGFLAFFKYVPHLASQFGGESFASRIPAMLGISYFSFKLVHYAVEVARQNITDRSLQQFLTYMFLVPIFTAGPIERYDHFIANQESRWSASSAGEGLTRIIYGLIKKFVIAEMILIPRMGTLRDGGVVLDRLHELPSSKLWAFSVLFYLVSYMDFSAYSDIAIGSARLFGLRIMENFNWPILAPNIGVFWKRWHMTLAGWCQSYVYMPMIGLTRNPYLAIYATFIVMGLWHNASSVWLMWGIYHATAVTIFLVWSKFRRKRKWFMKPNRVRDIIGIALTFTTVSLGSMITCMHGYGDAIDVLRIFVRFFSFTS